MNNDRRKRLDTITARMEDAYSTFVQSVESIASDLDSIIDEERDYRDNMLENMEASEKAANAEEAIDELEEAKFAMDNLTMLSEPEEITTHIDKAKGT